MKILITGSNGMLAKAVKKEFINEELICTDVDELDITDSVEVEKFISKTTPEFIINCAAYTNVNKAEKQPNLAYKINAIGPKNLAIAAKKYNCILIHISTDYVFGGNKKVNEYYYEDDEKKPEAVYGTTKLEGEKFIEKNCSDYYIFRTAWLYGDGNNFVRTMIKLSENHTEVSVVNDQHGSPTYTVDLANIIHQAINKELPYGIYNATNLGYTTWFDFTKEIYDLMNINIKINPVSSEQFSRPDVKEAKRPKNSQMSKDKLIRNGIIIPRYEEALKRYLEEERNKNNE